MSREVRFSFDTASEKADFEIYARAKGLTLSALAKHATYAYRSKNSIGAHHALTGRKRGRPTSGKRGAQRRPIFEGNPDGGTE